VLVEADILAQRFGRRPSDLLGLVNPLLRYEFDRFVVAFSTQDAFHRRERDRLNTAKHKL
jgi:hypothetical protein